MRNPLWSYTLQLPASVRWSAAVASFALGWAVARWVNSFFLSLGCMIAGCMFIAAALLGDD